MEEASASSTAPPAAPGPEVAPPGPPPAPSPLSGGYLLIILGEPHCEEHKDIILQRLAKGFLSWDSDVCHVDLEKELLHLAAQNPDGEESKNGERLIQFASESLVTEVLIQPQTTTLIQCARNLLSSFTRHRHIIHAGYTFAGNGSWALQDGTFSLLDFLDALREPEPQRVIRAYENNVSIDIQCSAEGEWSTAKITKEPGTKGCMVRVNPDDKMTAGSPGITQFVEYISNFLVPARIEELLEPSDVVGNIRFSHPTLYVFPGGQGDAALFGINGFNMLVDGGYSRKSCFWDFTRHLDRLDAVMVTRINNSNVGGIASVLKRKTLGYVYPQIGHFFCNMQERRSLPSPDGDKDRDPLLIDLLDEGHSLIANLRLLELKPHACYRDSVIEPINLYHKVGHGKLDMYVLSPAKDSKDVREFLAKWSTNDQKLFTSKTSKLDSQFPLYNMTSICALLVWQPANPTDTITRILFPGSTPQHKIFEGLEKIKHLEFLKFPTCTAKSMALSAAPKPKSKLFDKPAIETKVKKITPAIEKSIPIEPKSKLLEAEKNNKNNLSSQRVERKSTSKQEDKKDSPPTPKKAVEAKPKIEKVKRSRSPTIPPAKSDKEANNRKVLESKIEKSKTSTVKSAPKREPPKETKAVSEKKFVSLKKPKAAPPAKPSPPVSPKKQLKPKSSPKKVLKREVKSTTKKVERVIKAKAPPALADEKPGESKVETEEPKPAHVEIEAVDDVLTATIVKEVEAAEEQSVEAADGEAPSALQSQAEDVTEEDILSDKQGDADEKVSETEGDIDTQVDEEMVTDDGENKHIRDEEESEKERAKKDTAEAEGVDAQIEEQEEEKQLEADVPEVTDAGVEVTTEIVPAETPEKEIEIKEGHGVQDQEVLDAKDEPLIVERSEEISADKLPEIIKEKEAEEEVKDTADETVAPVQSDENQIEVKDVTPELCGVVDVIAAAVADEQTVEEKDGKDISEETKQKIEGEVKEIITSAQSKVAEEDATKETRETESVAVEVDAPDTKIDISSEKQKEDSPQEDKKDIKMEEGTNTKSQPDEKLSAMETSATTAPSMPEDEKIDDKIILDGIVEEKVEEKLVVAEVKEAAPPTIEPLKAIQLEQTHLQHHRDLVKTPDEVADLPMHEEVDGVLFDSSDDKKNDEDKIEQSPESLANKAAAKIDESVPEENINATEVAAEGTEVIESTPEQNEEQTKEIIGIKEMQKSAIDEKEVDTTLESKHDKKPTEAGSSLQKDMDEDVKEEVDAVPIGHYHEVEEAVGQEIKNVGDEKKDEEKKTPSPVQETKIDQKDDDAVDSAAAQNGLELSEFEKVIDEEYGIKTQMKPAAEEPSIKAEAVVEVQSLSISTKFPDKEALDIEEKDKESPKGDLELAEVETGSDGHLNDLSREKDEFIIDIDEKGSDAVGRRLSQTSPKQDLKLLEEETEEAIKDEPRSVEQKPGLSESDKIAPTEALDETTSLNQPEASREESKQTSRTPSPQVDTLPEAEPKTSTEKSNSPLPVAVDLVQREDLATPVSTEPSKIATVGEDGFVKPSDLAGVKQIILDSTETMQLDSKNIVSQGSTDPIKEELTMPKSPLEDVTGGSRPESAEPMKEDSPKQMEKSDPIISSQPEPTDKMLPKVDAIFDDKLLQHLGSAGDDKQDSTGASHLELIEPAQAESREHSRPQSSAKLHMEDATSPKPSELANVELKDSSRPVSSDEIKALSPEPMKIDSETSRPVSAELENDDLKGKSRPVSAELEKLENNDITLPKPGSKEGSRPESTEPETVAKECSGQDEVKIITKEHSHPESAELSKTEPKGLSRPESTEPVVSDSRDHSRPASTDKKLVDSKDQSRPESSELKLAEEKDNSSSRPVSAEPAKSVANDQLQLDLTESKDQTKTVSTEPLKKDSTESLQSEPAAEVKDSKEPSRPASTELPIAESKEPSRPESVEVPKEPSRPESVEVPKESSRPESVEVPKEPSRPESVEVPKEGSKEPSRPASTEVPRAESREPSRPQSAEPEKADSKVPSRPASTELPKAESKELSRPESAEIEKAGSKESSRPASTEVPRAESKEPSRPQSAELEKADTKEPSRPASEELAKAESKEPSRPESADVAKDGSKEPSRPTSTELPKAESKEPSRPESADVAKDGPKEPSRPASTELPKAESKEPSRPESADVAKDGSKEPSRPTSTELPKAESKEPSRPESADVAKDGSKDPSRPASTELPKAESKEPSRPESADVAKDGSKDPSRPASTELPKAESKEPSRPESAEVVAKDGLKEPSRPASTELPKAESTESSRPQSTEPKKADSKEPSRPASTELPKAEFKEHSQPESTEMAKDGKKEPSRPASTEVPRDEVKELSRPQSTEQEKAGPKESSRPESAEVVMDDKKEPSRPASTEVPKDEVKELSRPQSAEKERAESKEPSRPASTELTKVDSKEPPRPESAEEAKDGSTELSRPTSTELPKVDSKEASRPESAEEAKDGSTELSRPTSTELPKLGSIDPLPLQSAEPEKAGSKESSRPASTEAPKSESKDLSRPESVEPVKLESNEPSRPVSTQEEKIDTKQPSLSESTQPSKAESLKQDSTEAYSVTDAKENSRPESTQLKSDSKDTSRPESAEPKNIECKEELHSVSQSKTESSKSIPVEPEIVELKKGAVDAETLGRPESTEMGKIAAEVLSRPESTQQGSKEASRPTSTELQITKQSDKAQSKDEDVEQSGPSKTSRPVSTGEEEKSQEPASSKSVEQVSADKNMLQEVVEDFALSKLETIHSALDSTSSKETTQEQSLPLATNSDEQSCKESKETIEIREKPTIVSGETYQEYSEANTLTSSEKTDDLTSKKMDALFTDDKEITKSPSPEPELRDIEFFKEEKSPSPAPSINEANALLNGKPLSGAPSPLPPLDTNEKIPVVEASLEPISLAKIESEDKVSVREETLSAESITKEVETTEVDAHIEKSESLKDLKLGSSTVASSLAETEGGNNSSLLTNTEIQSAQHVPTEPSVSLSPILIADDFTQSKEATSLEKSPSPSRTVVEESKLPINGQAEKSEPIQFVRKLSDGVSASPTPKDLDVSGSTPLPMEHSSNDKQKSKSPSPAPSLIDEKKSPSPEPSVKDKDSKTPSPQPTKLTESKSEEETLENKKKAEITQSPIHDENKTSPTALTHSILQEDEKSAEPSKQTAASHSAEKTPSPSEVSDPITASYIEIINKLQSDSTESGGGKPVLAQIDDPMTRSTLFEQDIDSSDVPEYEKTQIGAEIDPLQSGDEHTIKKSHHRLMLTASSEDGGGETEFDTVPLTSQEKGIKIEPEKPTDVGESSTVRVSTPPSSSAEKKTSSTGVNVDKFSIPEDVKTIERAVDKQIELDHSSIFVAANVPLKDDIEISSTKMYDSSKVSNTERVPSPGYESDHDNVPPSPHSDISSGQMSRDPHVWDDNRSSSRQSEISDKDISSPPFTTSKMKFDVTPQSVMTGSFYGGLPGDEEFAPIESIAKDVKDSKNQIAKLGEIAIATESAVSESLPMAGPSLSSQEKAEPKSTSTAPKDPIESWGKPLGLPSPAPPATNDTIGSQHGTPKKEKTAAAKKAVDRSKAKSNKDASTKNKIPTSPMYFDLTYVPHHGNSNYSQVEFFKNVRARYYVFSGIEPSKEVYDALLEGKQSWDEKDLEVTIIPTYDTDTLGQWVAENEESIALNKIDLSPSASRCTINLQDHETSCSAYRLEF